MYLEHGITSKAVPSADLDPGGVDLPRKHMLPLPPRHLSKAKICLDPQRVELERPLGISPRQVELVQLLVASGAVAERLVMDRVVTPREYALRRLAGAGPHDLIHKVVRAAPLDAIVVVLAGAFSPGATLGIGARARIDGLGMSDAEGPEVTTPDGPC